MNGAVQGGWGFVWAAYSISALMFLGYGLSIWVRLRSERKRLAAESADSRTSGNSARR